MKQRWAVRLRPHTHTRRYNYLGILAEVPTALQQVLVQTPGRLTTAEVGQGWAGGGLGWG